jgi:hypothetical protein
MAKEMLFRRPASTSSPSSAVSPLLQVRPFAPARAAEKLPLAASAVQRAPVKVGRTTWNTRNASDKAHIVGYLQKLYREGKHDGIETLRDHIAGDRHSTSQFFLDFIDRMMQYGGLNRLVQNVALASGEQNFAQGFVRVYGPNGTIIHSVATDAQGSGEEEEQAKGDDRWQAVQGKKDQKESKVSLKDSEAVVCDNLQTDIESNAEEIAKAGPTRVELHLVTNNGPCDGCKKRIDLLMLDIKSSLGGDIPVNARIYYLRPPREKTRGRRRREVETTYGWMGDLNENDQGIFTHDLEA